MASISALYIARIGNAWFNKTFGKQTMDALLSEVQTYAQGDPVKFAGLVYEAYFASFSTADIGNGLANNLGLSGTAAAQFGAVVAGKLNAVSTARERGAVLLAETTRFASSTDATYGAAATKFNAEIDAALNYAQISNTLTVNTAADGTPVAMPAAATYVLTNDIDVATAHIFTSVPVYTPGGNDFINSLQDEDKLTGTSATDDRLDVTLGSVNDAAESTVVPTLTAIETVNVAVTGSTAGINFQDSSDVKALNVTRVTQNNATVTFADISALTAALGISNVTRAGDLTFAYKEEVLTGTAESLTVSLSDARASALSLSEGTDGGADSGNFFESIAINATGTNDIDTFTIAANGREDVVAGVAADTTKQVVTLTAGAAPGAAGSFEVNVFNATGVDTLKIIANQTVDIAADKAAALASSNGLNDIDLERLEISGGSNVRIDGLEGQVVAYADTKGLTVAGETATGNIRLGIVSATAGDDMLKVTTGSGADEIRAFGDLGGDIVTNAGADKVVVDGVLKSRASIDTGADADTVTATDLQATGDTLGASKNEGADFAASIATGSGDDTVTIAAMGGAVKWDDNNPVDVNVDDRYQIIGASVTTDAGADKVTISGSMAEAAKIDTGAGADVVTYTLTSLTSALAGDTDSAQEYVMVDDATAAVDVSTLDLDGAVIQLGDGDDTITFNDNVKTDTNASAMTLLVSEAGAGADDVDGAGAKLDGGTGADTLTVNTKDDVTVVSATNWVSATKYNTAALIKGVDTISLNILNSVDSATETDTGAAANINGAIDTDMANTAITLDVMRVDTDLDAINLSSQEKALKTLAGVENYESGDDTAFTLNNMRTNVALSLTAFDATAVVGATNSAVATAKFADDGAIDLYAATSNIATAGDVTLNLNFALANANTDADSFTLTLAEGTYGDERDSTKAGFDLDLNLGVTNQVSGWTTATSATDDNDLVIENLTLALDGKNHLIDLGGFGDAQQTDARANQVNAVATSLTVTGSAAGAAVDLYNVTADTITADIAANVDIFVGALSNKYTVTTGSGNDNVHMGNDLVTPNLAAVTGDESDTVALGAGTDRLVINGGNNLLSTGSSSTTPDGFGKITGVEILRVDANFGGASNQISMDETAAATGINTIEITGTGAQATGITLSENFNTDLKILSATMGVSATTNLAVLDADANKRYDARASEATSLTLDIQDVAFDSDVVNLDVTLGLDNGSQLKFVDAGLEAASLTVNAIVAKAGATLIQGASAGTNNGTAAAAFADGTALTANANPYNVTAGTLQIINQDAAASIDTLKLLETETAYEAAAITVVVDNAWSVGATHTLTIDGSELLNTDVTSGPDATGATGGLKVDGSMELDGKLVILGGANGDTLWGGSGADTINGGAGNDSIIADFSSVVVIDGIQQISTLTFRDDTTAEAGDTYTVTVGTNTVVYRMGEHYYTLNGVKSGYSTSAHATTIDGLLAKLDTWLSVNADADADADVNITATNSADPNANVLTVYGIDVANNNDATTSALGETIAVSASVTNAAAVAEVMSINLNGNAGEDWNAGETVSLFVDWNGNTVADAGETYSYTVGTGSPLGTVISDATVATGLAAVIDLDANLTATATDGVITVTAPAGTSVLFDNASVSVTGESAYAKQYRYDISALVDAASRLTVSVNGNSWTSAAYSVGDDDVGGPDTAAAETIDLSQLLSGLQGFLQTQLANPNIVVAAVDADTFTVTGASGAAAVDFAGPTFNLVGSAGTVVKTQTQAAADATATAITKLASDIRLEVLGTAVGSEVNQGVTVATAQAAVAAQFGSAAADTIDGGTGTDTLSYAFSTAAVTVNLGLATAQTSTGDASGDVITNVENLIGSAFADTLSGAAGVNVLTGGAGADVFSYGSLANVAAQTGITLATADTISDFVSGSDVLKLGVAGTAANYVEAAAAATFAAAQTAADAAMNGTVIYYLTSTAADGGLLFIDTNGDGTADALIKLTGVTDGSFALGDIGA